MSECPHCVGTGRIASHQTKRLPALRGAAVGPLPPFGRDVEARAAGGMCPSLFVATCPMSGRDLWQDAQHYISRNGPGSAMVLPIGDSPSKYRWPNIPWHDALGHQLAVWAHNWSAEAIAALGAEIIMASNYETIFISGGEECPMTFEAAACRK